MENNKQAFTLMELIAVVVIIGILASVAIPTYMRSRERIMDKQAISMLNSIRAAERAFRVDVGTYYPSSGTVTNVNFINGNLSLDLIDDNTVWNYSITGGATTFTAAISRNRGGFDRSLTIDQNNQTTTCSPNAPSTVCP